MFRKSDSFFFADSRKKKGFQPAKSLYFCVGQQKKKKEPLEKNRDFGTCKPAKPTTQKL